MSERQPCTSRFVIDTSAIDTITNEAPRTLTAATPTSAANSATTSAEPISEGIHDQPARVMSRPVRVRAEAEEGRVTERDVAVKPPRMFHEVAVAAYISVSTPAYSR
ncbi:hypothetical protein [Nonomuraea dietziae]|uniref:hypothetical protein n=1 Tax=Nonomuraea dietziae TaxID=65515 RepID=UPI0031DB3887